MFYVLALPFSRRNNNLFYVLALPFSRRNNNLFYVLALPFSKRYIYMTSTKKRNIPLRYVPKSLSSNDKKKQIREINKSRSLYKKNKYHQRENVKSFRSKKSNHITKAKDVYNVVSIIPNKKLSNKTGCSIDALERIVKKGLGAMYSSGSRPNQTAHSWAYARLASSITGGKSASIDFHIIKDGCKKTGKAYKLALKALKKHGRGTRKVPKIKF